MVASMSHLLPQPWVSLGLALGWCGFHCLVCTGAVGLGGPILGLTWLGGGLTVVLVRHGACLGLGIMYGPGSCVWVGLEGGAGGGMDSLHGGEAFAKFGGLVPCVGVGLAGAVLVVCWAPSGGMSTCSGTSWEAVGLADIPLVMSNSIWVCSCWHGEMKSKHMGQ